MAGGYEVGKAYVTIIPSAKGFTKGLGESVLPQTEETGKQAGGKFGSGMKSGFSKVTGVIAGVVSAVASRGIDVLSNSLDGAIKRVDTINNFPRVLTSLGYSADDAAKSVSKISDHINGLPTTLDSMTSSVQQILPSVKNVDKASDIMLAFNDALIAGGKGTEYQQAAIEQFSQVLAKGLPEMQDWRSIEVAMPGQLDQVAKSLLGTTANSNDLYEALQSGSITMDDFTNKLVELDKNGANGFASFSDQARAAIGGIGVQINLIGTRIQKGVGNVINAIGADNFIRPLEAISAGVDTAFGKIIDIVNKTKAVFTVLSETSGFKNLEGALSSLRSAVENTFGTIIQTVKDYIIQITGVQNTGDFVKIASDVMAGAADGINKAADALNKLTDWCSNHRAELETAAVSIGVFVGAVKTMQGIDAIITAVSTAIKALSAASESGGLMALIAPLVSNPVVAIIAGVVAAIAGLVFWLTQTESGKAALEGIQQTLKPILDALSNFFTNLWPGIQSNIEGVKEAFKGIGQALDQLFGDALAKVQEALNQPWVKGTIDFLTWLADQLIRVIGKFLENLPTILNNIGAIFLAVGTFIVSIIALIIGGIVDLAANIIDGISKAIQWVNDRLTEFATWLHSFGPSIWQAILNWIDGAKNIFWGLVGYLTGLVGTLWSIITGQFDKIPRFVQDMVSGISRILGGIAETILSPFNEAFKGLKRLWNNTIGGFKFSVPDWLPGIGGKTFSIPKLATGGTLTTGGTVMVGESGPELLTLPRGARVTPLDAAGVGTAGGTTYNLAFGDVNLTDKAAAQQAAREFIEYLIRISS